VAHQLAGNLRRKGNVKASLDLDGRQLALLCACIVLQFSALTRKVSTLGIGL
jgi:hypothetical protein